MTEGVSTAQAAETNSEGQTDNPKTGFSASNYVRRTRDVLKNTTGEASKLQSDARAALWSVWQDLRSDINTEISTLSSNVKGRASALRQRLPFAPKAKAEGETESSEQTAPSNEA